ncbi:MAG: DegT/DnrJ/EryC1/StrS family aminotransferase [Bacteroidales bacterium]|nr:DegT/DnrJ/EryC1/StrS family aminotransferase [Bacteroidales bacterium]
MKNIQMVDLKSQYQKIKSEINNSISEVIESAAFINGSKVKEFQRNLESYLKVKHVIPCGNGTDALQAALMALNLKSGDEVITADFTFIATVEVVALLGLKLKFVDVNPETFNLDVSQIEKAITPDTKAIVPVHLFGQAADMDVIMKIAEKYNLYVIEDTAQAIGADYTLNNRETKKLGTIGTVGCTSFFPSKNLGAFGDGGALYTNDDKLAEKIRQITNHGSKVKYFHDEVGVNSRLDSIQAAILNVKLKYLDNYISARQKAAEYYDKAFKPHPNIIIPVRDEKSTHVFHQYTIKVQEIDRDGLKEFLNRAVFSPGKIGSNKQFYFVLRK